LMTGAILSSFLTTCLGILAGLLTLFEAKRSEAERCVLLLLHI
jgi:hypothetical protein